MTTNNNDSSSTILNVPAEGKKQANVPNLRFINFESEWIENSLSSVSERVNRKANYDSDAPVRMLSYGKGFILQSEKYSRENAGNSLKNYTLLKRGELAYNHGASKNKPYGICYMLTESSEARVPFVYHSFKIINGCPGFWHYSLNTIYMDKQLKKIVSSGARMDGLLNITYQDYMSIKVFAPQQLEQEKIAKFLQLIDERIETQSKIIEKLESQMKAIYHKLFDNIGECSSRKLKDICTICKGTQVNGTELSDTGNYYER